MQKQVKKNGLKKSRVHNRRVLPLLLTLIFIFTAAAGMPVSAAASHAYKTVQTSSYSSASDSYSGSDTNSDSSSEASVNGSKTDKESLEEEKTALEGQKTKLASEAAEARSSADAAYQARQDILSQMGDNQKKLADAEVMVSLSKDGISEVKEEQKTIRQDLREASNAKRKVLRTKYDSPAEEARAKAQALEAVAYQRTQLSISRSEMKTARQEKKQAVNYYRYAKKQWKDDQAELDQEVLNRLKAATKDWTDKYQQARDKEAELAETDAHLTQVQAELDAIEAEEEARAAGQAAQNSVRQGNEAETGDGQDSSDGEDVTGSSASGSSSDLHGTVDRSLTGQKAVEAYGYENPSTKGEELVNYALQFVGNPYVWGGTSLTRGCDCSGFVQQVYKEFGVNLTRTCASQLYDGRSVSYQDMQPGDVINYGSHTAIYIGNNRIVHASSKKTGIIVQDNPAYRQILDIRRMF
ncbi:MAG: NlpC/P60 family protein [Lachnospiraceae bacterium]|jgi:cell wall-associated NlpC family hydrolase|nr:NlpC/P60 family protein [Lachnospiraceae bacterium]